MALLDCFIAPWLTIKQSNNNNNLSFNNVTIQSQTRNKEQRTKNNKQGTKNNEQTPHEPQHRHTHHQPHQTIRHRFCSN